MAPAETEDVGTVSNVFERRPALAVLAGGVLGAALRELAHTVVPPTGFPASTLVVNLAGAGLLGWFVARRQAAVGPRWAVELWAIGALGSLTTFSTFAVEVVDLLRTGEPALAAGYAVASLFGGVASAVIGMRWGRRR